MKDKTTHTLTDMKAGKCITDTCTYECTQKHATTLQTDTSTNTNKLIHTPSLFSVVEHLPHIKNKFIQSQFGECSAMQGRNTI